MVRVGRCAQVAHSFGSRPFLLLLLLVLVLLLVRVLVEVLVLDLVHVLGRDVRLPVALTGTSTGCTRTPCPTPHVIAAGRSWKTGQPTRSPHFRDILGRPPGDRSRRSSHN